MRSRTVSDASAKVPISSEPKIEDLQPATRRDYYEAADATFLALAECGQEHDPSHEGPVGCQIDLLEEFLDVLAQGPNVTMPEEQ